MDVGNVVGAEYVVNEENAVDVGIAAGMESIIGIAWVEKKSATDIPPDTNHFDEWTEKARLNTKAEA